MTSPDDTSDPTASLSEGDRELVNAHAAEIKRKHRNTIVDTVDIGRRLNEVKRTLPRRKFGLWLKKEFGWSQRSAAIYMRLWREFGDPTILAMIANLPVPITVTALDKIAASNAPQQVLAKAVVAAEASQPIDTVIAEIIVKKRRRGRYYS
jgi:hypothetical protein